jgi:uncharacterized peroxidase-related enzyme
MPHIKLKEGLPGIRGLMSFRPETAVVLNKLVDVLLRDNQGLSPGEREIIATYVSYLNDCYYCQTTHGSVAEAHFGGDQTLIQEIKSDFQKAAISDKLKKLLIIAAQVQKSGKSVTDQAIQDAKSTGASDLEIHDTVLIAAAFCMFNRYVDGLATWSHNDMDLFRKRGAQVAREGYTQANIELFKNKT